MQRDIGGAQSVVCIAHTIDRTQGGHHYCTLDGHIQELLYRPTLHVESVLRAIPSSS
jgi:hypothetical protein